MADSARATADKLPKDLAAEKGMVNVQIDGAWIQVPRGTRMIEACRQAEQDVPHYCYHSKLSSPGNCRMCLVQIGMPPRHAPGQDLAFRDDGFQEIRWMPRPVIACANTVAENMGIRTSGDLVEECRNGVMEFLLANHPLDCPICDQGGECDLQDQAMAYGVDFSRYREPKRATEDLDLGPLVETHMTRCISCTRCVRFTTEVAGIHQMGQTGRGEDAEITAYLGQTLDSNLQGNIIDLCPVGALVSKPYAFTARPWELSKTESIDVMDALGSNIRVDTKGREVMRFLPRNHDGVNEEWISDKTRFVWDGLRRQRLDRPYVRENGKLRPASWPEALGKAAEAIKGAEKPVGLVGDLAPVEAAFALKELIEGQGGSVECRTDGAHLPAGNRSGYVGTASIADIDSAGAIMLIGCNPALEAPVLNARIRGAWSRGAKVGVVGEAVDLTYEYFHLGSDRAALDKLVAGDNSDALSRETLVILGQGAIREADGAAVLAKAMAFADHTESKFLVLHSAASRVGAMDVGAVTEGGLAAAMEGASPLGRGQNGHSGRQLWRI